MFSKLKTKRFLPIVIIIIMLGAFVFSAAPVFAQDGAGETAPALGDLGLDDVAATTGLQTETGIKTIIGNIIKIFLGFVGLIALGIVIYAGFLWMTAGGDDAKTVKARKWMINGLIGLAIIFAAYAITSFVISRLISATGPDDGTFQPGGEPGTLPPGGSASLIVKSVSPQGNVSIINVNPKIVFSKSVDKATVEAPGNIKIIDKEKGRPVLGDFKVAGKKVTFVPREECVEGGEVRDISCGDGELNDREECDDGNGVNGDGCNSYCLLEPFSDCSAREGSACCGNGVVEENCLQPGVRLSKNGNEAVSDTCSCGPRGFRTVNETQGLCCDDFEVNYEFEVSEAGDYQLRLKTRNDGSNAPMLSHQIKITLNGENKGSVENRATNPAIQEGVLDLGYLSIGDYTVNLDWIDNTEEGVGLQLSLVIDSVILEKEAGGCYQEECDIDGLGCSDGCLNTGQAEDSVCGNGLKEAGEDGDDGNTESGDGLDENCLNEGIGEWAQALYSFEKNTEYEIIVKEGGVQALGGGYSVSCVPGSVCRASFTTGSVCDRAPPEVVIETPIFGANVCQEQIVPVTVQATDDAGVGSVSLYLDRTGVTEAIDVMSPATNVLSYTPTFDWITDLVELGQHDLTAVAEDIDGHSAIDKTRVNVKPASCCDDEGDIICGSSECGSCPGDSCNVDADCADGECVEGICVAYPTITNINPKEGVAGNFVTISGSGFGSYNSEKSKVLFTNSSGDRYAVEADLGCNANLSWKSYQVIVRVPDGFGDGPIRLINEDNYYDDTANERGWQGDFLVNENLKYPGLCSVTLEDCSAPVDCSVGLAAQNVELVGDGFGDRQEDSDKVYFGENSAALGSGGFWNNQIIRPVVIPNLVASLYNVVVGRGERCLNDGESCVEGEEGCVCLDVYSNPVKFEIKTPQVIPRIQEINPYPAPAEQTITVKGTNFGFDTGSVIFKAKGGENDGQNYVAPLACDVNSWTENQIVVKVPAELKVDPSGISEECRIDPSYENYIERKDAKDVSADNCTVGRNIAGRTFLCEGNFWADYKFEVPADGAYEIVTRTRNYRENLPDLNHNIDVSVDGRLKGTVNPAATALLQTAEVDIGFVTAGEHTVRLNWTNDFFDPDIGDLNLMIFYVHLQRAQEICEQTGLSGAVDVFVTAGSLVSEPYAYQVSAGEPGPGICAIDPDNGPNGMAVDFIGDNFATADDYRVQFSLDPLAGSMTTATTFSSWTEDLIKSVIVPNDAASGKVYLQNKNDLTQKSNEVQFKVGSCLGNGGCEAGSVCCSSGICLPAVQGETVEQVCGEVVTSYDSEYAWIVSTGDIPKVPKVLERYCVTGGYSQSPSPAKDDEEACPNGIISATFNMEIALASLNNNITVKRCTTAGDKCDLNSCAASNCVADTIVGVAANDLGTTNSYVTCEKDGVTCDPDEEADCVCVGSGSALTEFHLYESLDDTALLDGSDLYKNSWYQVEISGGDSGVQSAGSEMRMPSDYQWTFKTKKRDCELENLLLSPLKGLITQIDEQERFLVSGQYQCQILSLEDELWGWSVDAEDIPKVNFAGFGCKSGEATDLCSSAGGNARRDIGVYGINPSALDADGLPLIPLETTADDLVDILVAASISGVHQEKEGTIEISFGDPRVTSVYPTCNEACINTQISADFNIQMNENDFNSNNVRLFSCFSGDCLILEPVPLINDEIVYHYAVDADGSLNNQVDINLTSNLAPNKFYRVVISGAVESFSGVPLTELNYSVNGTNSYDSYSWIFKTKNDSNECLINEVVVAPLTRVSRTEGEQVDYSVTPLGAPDSCSSSGQRLNPYQYQWSWVSSALNVATISKNEFSPELPTYCSDDCLLKGSAKLGSVCGNSNIELGEECDTGNAVSGDGDGCSDRCLLEPFANCVDSDADGLLTDELNCCGNGDVEPICTEGYVYLRQNGSALVSENCSCSPELGEKIFRCCSNFQAGYDFNVPESGNYKLEAVTRNYPLDLPDQNHQIEVVVVGMPRGMIENPARNFFQSGQIDLYLTEGLNRVYLYWTNDTGADLNLEIVSVILKSAVGQCVKEECDGGSFCTDGCLNKGTGTGFVCGNSEVEAGEDADDGNNTSGDGISGICLNEGSKYKSTDVAVSALCGNGVVEPGEECDDPDNFYCNVKCLWKGFPACGVCTKVVSCDPTTEGGSCYCVDFEGTECATDGWRKNESCSLADGDPDCLCNQCCGNGIRENYPSGKNSADDPDEECEASCFKEVPCEGEACEDGEMQEEPCDYKSSPDCVCEFPDGCSTSCLNEGSDLDYDSFCGDGVLGAGEDLECEPQGGEVSHLESPYQIATVVGAVDGLPSPYHLDELTMDAVGTTQITASTTQKQIISGTETDVPKEGSADLTYRKKISDIACGLADIAITESVPSDNREDVCRNPMIYIIFNQQVNYDEVTADDIRLSYEAGSCFEDEVSDAGWLRRAFNKVKTVFRSLFAKVGLAADCTTAIADFKFEQKASGATALTIFPAEILAPNEDYNLAVRGLRDQCLSPEGGVTKELHFRTGSDICRLDKVQVDPQDLFIIHKDQSINYLARPQSGVQPIVEILGTYEWDWSWKSTDSSIATVPDNNNTETVVTTSTKNGSTNIKATARITLDRLGQDFGAGTGAAVRYICEENYSSCDSDDPPAGCSCIPESTVSQRGASYTGIGYLDVFICDNPWFAQLENLPVRMRNLAEDSPLTNFKIMDQITNNAGTSVPTYLWEKEFNFGLFYCRDSGAPNDMSDDLPLVTLGTGAYTELEATPRLGIFFDKHNDYLRVPNPNAMAANKDWTIDAWIYNESLPEDRYARLFYKNLTWEDGEKGHIQVALRKWGVGCKNISNADCTWSYAGGPNSNGCVESSCNEIKTSAVFYLKKGTWIYSEGIKDPKLLMGDGFHHIALAYNGAGAARAFRPQVELFIDGVKAADGGASAVGDHPRDLYTWPWPWSTAPIPGYNPLYIGGLGQTDIPNVSLNSYVDDVRLWSYAKNEIQVNNTKDKTLKELGSATGLISNWKFDYDYTDSVGNNDAYAYCSLTGSAGSECNGTNFRFIDLTELAQVRGLAPDVSDTVGTVTANQCNDSVDNDDNGLTDLDDPKCRDLTDPYEAPALMTQYFFVRNIPLDASDTTYDQSADAISMRVYENPEALPPDVWYQRYAPSPASGVGSIESDCLVDDFGRYCYAGIQDGTSIYVAAANQHSTNVYNNIYLLSYSADSNNATRNIYSQMVDFLKFNINVIQNGNHDKASIIRDTKRMTDIVLMRLYIENYRRDHGEVPQLESGTYLRYNSSSIWPSWQAELGSALGSGLPVDPWNHLEWESPTSIASTDANDRCGADGDEPLFCAPSQQCVVPSLACLVCESNHDSTACYDSVSRRFKSDYINFSNDYIYSYNAHPDYSDRYRLNYKLETALNYVYAPEFEVHDSAGWQNVPITPPTAPVVTQCSDGIDNDGNGLYDYPLDPGCPTPDTEVEQSEKQCNDKRDNDGDRLIDENDPSCWREDSSYDPNDNDEFVLQQCRDGVDNDGHDGTDYPDDPGCMSAFDNDETSPACSDGADNDSDGVTDFSGGDVGCTDANDNSENKQCNDGFDNNKNSLTDLADTSYCFDKWDNSEGGLPLGNVLVAFFVDNSASMRGNDSDFDHLEIIKGLVDGLYNIKGDQAHYVLSVSNALCNSQERCQSLANTAAGIVDPNIAVDFTFTYPIINNIKDGNSKTPFINFLDETAVVGHPYSYISQYDIPVRIARFIQEVKNLYLAENSNAGYTYKGVVFVVITDAEDADYCDIALKGADGVTNCTGTVYRDLAVNEADSIGAPIHLLYISSSPSDDYQYYSQNQAEGNAGIYMQGTVAELSNLLAVIIGAVTEERPVVPAVPTMNDPGEFVYTGIQFQLSWVGVDGATKYRVQIATDSGFNNVIRQVEVASVDGTGLVQSHNNAGTYYYRVQAGREIAGEMEWSGWSSATDMQVEQTQF